MRLGWFILLNSMRLRHVKIGIRHAIFDTMTSSEQTILLLEDSLMSAVGGITLAGRVKNGRGVPGPHRWRVYGSYALMQVISGQGSYRDANGLALALSAGDVVLVFPELGHWYGPPRGRTWEEMYVVFNGPQFDLWRQAGLMSPLQPVVRPGEPDIWRERVEFALALPGSLQRMTAFLGALAEAIGEPGEDATEELDWLIRAKHLLGTDLGSDVSPRDVARQVGMGFDSFRARFAQATGLPPARYRAQHRIAAAKQLLLYTHLSLAEIAERLGYRDEFYFSKRFKHHTTQSPHRFRTS